jgi:hypothetical protein
MPLRSHKIVETKVFSSSFLFVDGRMYADPDSQHWLRLNDPKKRGSDFSF